MAKEKMIIARFDIADCEHSGRLTLVLERRLSSTMFVPLKALNATATSPYFKFKDIRLLSLRSPRKSPASTEGCMKVVRLRLSTP